MSTEQDTERVENFHESTLDELFFNENHAFDESFFSLEQPECATLHAETDNTSYDDFSPFPLDSLQLQQRPSSGAFPASSFDEFADLLNTPSSEQSSWFDHGSQLGYSSNTALDRLSWSSDQYPTAIPGKPPQGPNEHQAFASLPQPVPSPGHNRPGLPRRRSRYMINRSQSQTQPTFIPNASTLDPMQRWQESPPEDEPASMTAIMNAMEKDAALNTTTNAFHHHRRPASIASAESSASSTDSAWSSASQSGTRGARRRRPRTGITKSKPADTQPRKFCCTFCCDRFKTRYEWLRHEKSLHLNLETWYCAPLGPSVYSPITGRSHCAYCNALDPSPEHLATHNYDACATLSKEARSFNRKDHLVQHLRHFHRIHTIPLIEDWKIETKNITSRCGFCDTRLSTWDERVEHLARHFRRGCTMKEWKGDHDFPPEITARLKNAYPPYLLGWESRSMIPFSATSTDTRDHYAQVTARFPALAGDGNTPAAEPNTSNERNLHFDNFLNVFTRHLSRYAREQMENGVVPTDEMFQQESRRILYDSQDAWDQTIADNPDWLSSFRHLHCGTSNDCEQTEPEYT